MTEDLYKRLHTLSKILESSGRLDEHEHRDAYPAILDAMNALRAPLPIWQPIDTAPKDGTWVLLAGGTCVVDEGRPAKRPVTAQWSGFVNSRTGNRSGRWQFAWYDSGYYGTYSDPTHWMPLPPLPHVHTK